MDSGRLWLQNFCAYSPSIVTLNCSGSLLPPPRSPVEGIPLRLPKLNGGGCVQIAGGSLRTHGSNLSVHPDGRVSRKVVEFRLRADTLIRPVKRRSVVCLPQVWYSWSMEFLQWTGENWFNLIQTAAIVAGLVFTALSLRLDEKTRRISNLLEITQGHREIWTALYERPELSRLLDHAADVARTPVTAEEEVFVGLLILHLNSAFHAMKAGVFTTPDGLRRDIKEFFSLPAIKSIWRKMRFFQDAEFIRFVEANINNGID